MEDFNSFANNDKGNKNSNIYDLVKDLANKFDGKSSNELLTAIYKEAKRGKENGTLTNAEIDGFVNMLTPFFNDKQKVYLKKITDELKKM